MSKRQTKTGLHLKTCPAPKGAAQKTPQQSSLQRSPSFSKRRRLIAATVIASFKMHHSGPHG
jgi:hypothetical protein